MEKQIIEKIQNKLPMDIKKFAISMGFLTMVLTACGKNVVDTTPTNPTPTQTVETQVTPVEEDPEVTIPVVEPTNPVDDPVVEPVVENKYPDATIEKTGDNSYVIHIDCPDNSNAPEIANTIAYDATGFVVGSSQEFGISENLLYAILTHGMQTNPNNITEIDFKKWENYQYTWNSHGTGGFVLTITNDTSVQDRCEEAMLKSDKNTMLSADCATVCASLLHDCIIKNYYNISCGVAEYHEGPTVWNQLMQECMDTTGLTKEEICTYYDANYVYQCDTLGLGDHNYVNEVFQYMGNGEITVTMFTPAGGTDFSITYDVERVKTYGSLQP